jgi:hypothetical protein
VRTVCEFVVISPFSISVGKLIAVNVLDTNRYHLPRERRSPKLIDPQDFVRRTR